MPGPAQLVLMASVARRYFIEGRSKIEIGDEFGLSRFKVARLLDLAQRTGMVRIEIRHEGVIDVDLSARLRDALGLEHAVVVDTAEDDPASLRAGLGQAAAELLAELMTPQDVLGLAWARTVAAMAQAGPRLPAIPVVQLTGALSSGVPMTAGRGDSSVDVVREVARSSGGPAYVFYAPFILPDASTARALRRQPEIARAFERLPSVTKAVVGLGLWEAGQSTIYDAVDEHDRHAVRELGVCAEISGVFIDEAGEPIRTGLNDRMISIDAERMRAIPEVLVIGYGVAKAPAVRAAVRSGLLGGLVTHSALANALLDLG